MAARRLSVLWAASAALLSFSVLAGCTAVAQPDSQAAPAGTVSGVGELPGRAPTQADSAPTEEVSSSTPGALDPAAVVVGATDAAQPVASATTTSSVDVSTTTTVAVPIGAKTLGNRVLMIGDSLSASVAKRYGGEACQALVPLGWRLEVDAETGRGIDFGKMVLDKRLSAGWDAAIIFLGNNYGYDQVDFQARLHTLLLRLVPRPTVLITTSLFRPEQVEVNDAIRLEAAQFTSVTVIDWSTISVDPSLTGADNLHLTDNGRRVFAYQLAATMGAAPVQPGACLKTSYTNDSAGSPNGPPGNASATKTTTKPTTPRTTKPTTATTVAATSAGGTTPTTVKPTVTTTPTSPTATTATPTIPSTPTTPPTTQPPVTSAPATIAPTTPPPTIPQAPTTTRPG